MTDQKVALLALNERQARVLLSTCLFALEAAKLSLRDNRSIEAKRVDLLASITDLGAICTTLCMALNIDTEGLL